MEFREIRDAARLALKRGMQTQHFVYVLESLADPDRQYVGLAVNVSHRLEAHNAGQSPHTARHRPWRLLVAIGFADADRAVRFGKFLRTDTGRAFARHHFR